MKIENLTVGMTVKNYKSLCELLGVEPKSSTSTNSRKAHHKEFEQYFKYDKQGQKYIITEIFKDVKSKVDNRKNNKGGNNQVFKEDFKRLMLYLLHKNRSECMLISKGSLYKATNLVNENYLIARSNIPKLSEIIELPQSSIYEFYDNNGKKLRETVERNLKACRSSSILMFETVTAVAIYETIIATNEFNKPILDNNSNMIYSTNLVYREATKKERQRILEIEDEVKKELGYTDNQEIFLSGKWKYFKLEVEKKLKKANTNIKFYYEAYRVTWNNSKIDDEFNLLCKGIEQSDIKENLNKNMIESITKSNYKRHAKALDKHSFSRTKKQKYQASNDFLLEQEQLTFALIDAEAPSLKHDFEKSINHNKLNKINKTNENEQLELPWDFDDLESSVPF